MKWMAAMVVWIAPVWLAGWHDSFGQQPAVPFELNLNHPYVQVRINGSEPLSFMLDTGAQLSVVDRDVADRIGLTMTPVGGARGATSQTARLAAASGVTIELGPASTELDLVYVMPLNRLLSRLEGREIQGRLGSDFLSYYVVEMDHGDGVIRLHDPDSFEYEGSGIAVPLMLESRRPLVRGTIELTGKEAVDGTFLLSTSAQGPVYLSTEFVNTNGLLENGPPTRTGFVAGTGALDSQPVGRADTVRFGDVAIGRPLVYFSQHPAGGLAAQFGVDGVIGTEILRRFTVVWDYARSRVLLEPNRSIDEPFTHAIADLSGFYLLANDVDLDSVWVEEVVRGGPAERAGVLPGDVILAIDGHQIAGFTLEEIRRLFLRETTRWLQLKRRGQLVQVRLVLRESL